MSEVVILSPHLDDAVLDCWYGIIEFKATIVNVFAGIPTQGTSRLWDRVCGEADSVKMMHMRRRENEIAVATSNKENPQIYLDFLDNQYRKDDPSVNEIADKILAECSSAEMFLAPIAMSKIYRHPDHLLVKKVGLELRKRGFKVGFYPDAPYMSLPRRNSPHLERKVKKSVEKNLNLSVQIKINKLTKEQLNAKNVAMHAYKTQYKWTNLESFGGLKRIAKCDYELIIELV